MKQHNTDKDKSNCCMEQEMQDQNGCCSTQEAQDSTACCGGGCCSNASADNPYLHDNDHGVINSSDAKEALHNFQELLAEENDKYVRLYAEFENFKRRTAKERMTLMHSANEKTLQELLPIVDDFERGMIACQQEMHDDTQHAMHAGIKLIYDKLNSFLKKFGVEEMTLVQGSEFNADFHEAIMQTPVEDPDMKGKIITITEKGYLINGSVLRFAKVIIGL